MEGIADFVLPGLSQQYVRVMFVLQFPQDEADHNLVMMARQLAIWVALWNRPDSLGWQLNRRRFSARISY